jgi:DNA-directed RNA polymerase subunit RPC12/RpoP
VAGEEEHPVTHVHHCVVCPPKSPRKAEQGGYLVCFRCSNRILHWLRELEDYIPTLTVTKTVRGNDGRTPPGFASSPPADLDVLFHTDWRSDFDSLDGQGVLNNLHMWARTIREDRAVDPPERVTLTSEIACLRGSHQWITCQPYVDEYAGDLRQLHAAVRASANDPVPQAVGACITVQQSGECGGTVYERADLEAVQCSTCHRIYTGLELVRLRAAQETG